MEINRILLQRVYDHLNKEEITLLIGPRQAGKTTLLRSLADALLVSGE